MNVSKEYINQLFVEHLNTDAGRTKIASASGEYLKLRLRERSFARHILPPTKITKADCTRSEFHEGLVKIIDIEPDSKAMALNFRSEPTGRYITGKRYSIPFFTIASERYSKTEQELMTWEAPITKIVEDNIVKDIEYVEDSKFMKFVRAGIAAGNEYITGSAATVDGSGKILEVAGDLNIKSFTSAFNMIERVDPDQVETKGHVRPCTMMLMSQPTYNKINDIDGNNLGLELRTQVTKDGYTYNKFLGKNLVVTMKSDLVKPGEVFLFTSQEYLGHFFVLNDTRFYVDKTFNLVELQAMEEVGIGINSITGMAKLYFKDLK